ncbi:glucose-6-phosphate dehydrogenase [Alkalimarinus alittae]|uniref:Glucose-6-phosphate 1-dehydrogenase n=1 Tax=Alkalimarinus alittae TaxID=2961619 RepID=A0ABY6MXK0_9ALTE|nr:glucose-6-phosphate dehydrogenase [Alkalimarinus alittae]UZE94558.1 glucose-6-phosphate dehydrogenase [Alkalimarinus alittae]
MIPLNEPFDLVLFGASGDLSTRKLFPALFSLHLDGRLPSEWRLVALYRREHVDFIENLRIPIMLNHNTNDESMKAKWDTFATHIVSFSFDATAPENYGELKTFVNQMPDTSTIFYLATPSVLYGKICTGLANAQLNTENSRIVLEKPIGSDLTSAKDINELVSQHFKEQQIFRIDHYLGKETVQNLLVLRFANTIFESQWSQKYIDNIQITISETLGVEERAEFYDQVGALRDMGQNHLLQLLCIVAMEPPSRFTADAVRDEKVKVLRALRTLNDLDVHKKVVRGQYKTGVSNGSAVKGYVNEAGVDPASETETYVAMKVEIDNWRWAGVPFYLRTGKRLAHRACEIVVNFKEVPHSIFDLQHKKTMANKLVFRLQPDEGIRLILCEKKTGPGVNVRSTELSLSPDYLHRKRVPDAYERLLGDVISNNQTLFVRQDELIAAWEWLDPILKHWNESEQGPEPYISGSWGPAASTLMLAKDGRLWDETFSPSEQEADE